MKYVILKKINDVWYATRNRYTAKELEVIVDKLYDDVVDFEVLNDGDYQGLGDGVIIVKDDGRELDKNKKYLNDELKLETNSNLWVFVVMFVLWVCFGFYGIVGFCAITGLICLLKYLTNHEDKDIQSELPENHHAKGMM